MEEVKIGNSSAKKAVVATLGVVIATMIILAALLYLVPMLTGLRPEEYAKKIVPRGYYETDRFPDYGGSYSDLKDFLTSGFHLPTGYQEGIFDCSESAAYVEWALEDAGFNAWIAIGPAPWDPSIGYHAWVIVYTPQYKVALEATALSGYGLWDKIKHFFTGKVKGIVYEGDRGWYNYYHPPHSYPDIYEAITHMPNPEEWDWWFGV